jgi:hypothetical protein
VEGTAEDGAGRGCRHRVHRGQRGGVQVTSFRTWWLPPEGFGAAAKRE